MIMTVTSMTESNDIKYEETCTDMPNLWHVPYIYSTTFQVINVMFPP